MGGITTVGGVMKGVSDMKRIKIEWRKLRVFRRLSALEAAVERIERYVGMREPAVMGASVPSHPLRGSSPEGRALEKEKTPPTPGEVPQYVEGRVTTGGSAGGEKVPTAEEIMMMWRYTADEIADMNRPVGGGSR